MDLLQLKYFVKVAEEGSVSRAAEALFVSQPAVSRAVISLEKELGVSLFDRVNKRIYLNSNGKLFYERVSRSLMELNSSVAMLSSRAMHYTDTVRIANFSPSPSCLSCIKAFSEQYPYANFSISTQTETAARTGLRVFDAVFFRSSSLTERYRGVKIEQRRLKLLANKNNPILKKKNLSLADFRNEPFAFCCANEEMETFYRSLCLSSGFDPWVRYMTNSELTQRTLISIGLAVGFTDEVRTASENEAHPRLTALELEGENLSFDIMLGFRHDSLLTETARTFRDFALDYFHVPVTEKTLALFESAK